MRKLSPILFLVLVITSWNKISAQALSVVDLLSNSTQSLTSDASYFYFDSYLNLCLGQIQLCNEGFTVVFNLSLMFNAQENTESITYDSSYLNGRRVLASSGGDSRFTSGGFYLHQIDIRGDNHLELAVRSFDKLYIQNIYFEGKSDNYLACVWNKKSLTTYIDGSLYSTTSEPVELPFTSLNFNPIKNFKTLITRPQSSAVYQARFTDQVLSSTNELIKGTGKSTSSLQTPNRVPVGIKVNLRSLKPEYLEVNQPIGFEITFLNTMSTNFLTYVSVDNQELEVLIGKNFTFTEFDVAGRKKLNFTSVSLNYPKLTITEEFYIDVNPKLTSEPLYSLQLLVANVEASTKVTVSLSVSGGAPYTCFVNFGDKTNTSVESFVDRLTNKDFTHEYSSTGIFNVSATCSSGQVKESILTDSQIVYVRINSRQTDYENFNQVFLERINSESVELVLPFQACTEGIVLQVIDQSIQTVIENWICSDSQPVSKDGYMIVNLKLSQLTETYENYVSIRFTEFIQIASYLISWQEKIVQPPKIKILTENLQLDQPVDFEVTVDIYADSMIRIDFGDLDDNIILYQINGDVAEDQRLRVFSLRHVYKNRDDGSKIQKFSFNVQQANYMNLQSANVELTFELALSGFELSTSKNKLDEVNQEPIVFKIVPTTTDQPVKVSEIKLLFNDLEPTKFRLIKNFTFDQSNNFQLLINHTYTNYGIFQAVVNCSNSISSQIIKIKITVGKQLNSIDGYITNSYASIKSDITFFINISGGNGYNINLDLKNGKSIFVEWSQIRTRINSTAVKFTRPEGILITGSYDLVGTYSPEVNVTNPFGSLLLKFCSHIKVVAKSLNKLMSIQYQESCTLKSNLALLKNSIVVGMLGDRIEMGKGVTNSFSIGYTDCVSTENSLDSELAMYWHLRLLDQNSNQFNIPDGCMKNTTTDIINFKANSLLAGNYLLTIYAFDLSYPEEFYTLTKRLVVGASELMIRVNNPMYMELNWNEELRLDFVKNSYDPDETTGSTDLIAFDLLCVKDNDTDAQLAVLDTARNQSKFGNFDFSGIMELYFHGENLRIFSKGCFSFNSANLQPNPIKYLKGIVTVPALNISLDMTETRPILFEVLAHKDIRLAVSKQIKLSLNISSAFQIEPSSNLDDMSNKLNKVDELVSKNPTKALGLLKSFATAINDISSDSDDNHNVSTTTPANMEEQTSKLSNLRGKMLGTVDKIIGLVSDQSSLLSACETTSSVTSNPGQMPLGNQESGSRVMESMGEKMKDFKSDDEEGIKNIAESMLGTTGNVFSAASGSVPVVSKNFSEIDLLADENDVITEPPPIAAKITAPLIFYEMDTENFPEDLYEQELEEERIKKENDDALRKKTAKLAARTFNGISNAGGAISSNSNSSGNATKIESKGMALLVQKQKFNQSENSTNDQFRTESGPSIVMPALNKLISCKDGSAPSVSTKMFVSATNPFQSSDSNTQINGAIVSMELADDNGNPIPVHNTSEPFVIKVPAQEPARSYHAEIGLTQTNYYKTVLLTNISSLHVVLMPENEGDLYHVYIKFSANPKTDDSKYPDEKNYDFSFSLPKNKTNQEDLSELRYTAFIASNETKGNGTYYIAVKLYKLSHASIEYKKSLNDTEKTNKELRVNFTMRLFSTSCKYWSAESQAWLTDGCYVSGDTTYDTTVCHCYHLTTFGSDFYVPPNTIDFGSVFGKFANLNENSAVFATVLSIFGVYILIAIYSRYKDKKDLIKWGVTPLSDNLPTDNFYYVVQVQTGFGKECGTTSKVGMVLAGEQADSGVRKLTDDKRKVIID